MEATSTNPVAMRFENEEFRSADEMTAEGIERGNRLFAKLKRSSKYYLQSAPGALFPVWIDADQHGEFGYAVRGGQGKQYRLEDVNLYVKDDSGREFKIS